ncbi:uncharacterized protein LOC123225608 [Mangifera indica]|uniref:uncharacterized protein LOC123225608 n=1 Tax=Mangifera indica TaxID=29780 RepID=UPI001CFB0B61|nr:uncharacterized protein LOC123225608 [Mangifera indica]XP_044505638.1 uncharacterized protein LOC123225608 [Mangifera indica]
MQGWVNRFANAADAAMEIAGTTALRLRQARAEIVSASKVAYQFLLGAANNGNVPVLDSPSNSNRGTPKFQAAWFKNLITTGAKPSSSSDIENSNRDSPSTPEIMSIRSLTANESA